MVLYVGYFGKLRELGGLTPIATTSMSKMKEPMPLQLAAPG